MFPKKHELSIYKFVINVCFRQERGNCRICWTSVADIDVMLSSMTPSKNYGKGTTCCGYGPTGIGTKGYDCVQIPGALKALTTTMMGHSMLCGRSKGLGSLPTGVAAVTVCCEYTYLYSYFY